MFKGFKEINICVKIELESVQERLFRLCVALRVVRSGASVFWSALIPPSAAAAAAAASRLQ